MKALKIISIIIGAIAAILVIAYVYYGGFKTIVFHEEMQGGETLVYEEVLGDYGQTPAIQDKIYHALLKDEKIATTKGFGIYYDNPDETEKSRLRSEVGCIVEGLDSMTLAGLSQKYKVKTLPKVDCAVTEFPFKGKMSVLVGIMKVYPALDKYCKQHEISDSPIMEIYDIPNKFIIYRKAKSGYFDNI